MYQFEIGIAFLSVDTYLYYSVNIFVYDFACKVRTNYL